MNIFASLYERDSWLKIPIDLFCYFILRIGGQFCEKQYMNVILPTPIIDDPTGVLDHLKNSQYAKIESRISLIWGTKECNDYLHSLIITDRDDRQGFPPHIFEQLLKLYLYHEDKYVH